MKELPVFKYHPNPIETKSFHYGKETCNCCGKETDIYYQAPFYGDREISALCPFCISNGKAAEEFKGVFVEINENTINDKAINELTKKTPGYCGSLDETWLIHCDDFCSFHGNVNNSDIIIEKMNDFADLKNDIEDICNSIEDLIVKIDNREIVGYLFQCLHCKKYLLRIEVYHY